MAYDANAPYQPPRRQYPPQPQQNDGYYYDEAPQPRMGGQRPPPNNYGGGGYGGDQGWGGGEPVGRPQTSQSRRPPPSRGDGPFPSFAGGSRPDPSFEFDGDMLKELNVTEDGGGGGGGGRGRAPPRQRGPMPRGGMQRSASENMRRGPPPGGDPYMNGGMGGMGGPRYPPRGGGPPPGRGRGPPPNMRMPPHSAPPPVRGGYRPPGGPPMRAQTEQGYQNDGWNQGYDGGYDGGYERGYDRGYDGGYERGYDEPEFGPPQRSMTMPNSVTAPQQYTAYNPARHGTPQPETRSAPPPLQQPYQQPYQSPQQDPYYGPGQRRAEEAQWPRESVGALLDYYTEPEDSYNTYQGPGAPVNGYQVSQPAATYPETGSNPGTPTRRNFSRPVNSPGIAPPGFGQDQSFAQQAHRSKSQPDLRGQTNANGYGGYDGAVDVPPVPRNMTPNGYKAPPSGYPGGPAPASLRTGPSSVSSSTRSPMSQGGMPPPARAGTMPIARTQPPQVQSQDSLPEHPTPADMKEVERPELLPAHPPPIRPGLMPDAAVGFSQPPAPVRQYSPERSNSGNAGSSEPPPITITELQRLGSQARANPQDQKMQLNYAKRLVEAATVLANESGRADVKTTRKNRENYINDAHKIVKKLTTGSHPYPDAMFYLAQCHGEGQLGFPIDHSKAFNLYQSGAKLNHAPSAYRTAVCCELGAGTSKDPLKSITWYKKAASLGETPAMFKLGMILLKGLLGQQRNPRDAVNWLKRAASQADENNQHALHELALLYERQEGNDIVIPDQDYARELFVKAAELNYPASQFRMGCAYEYGLMGCPIDPRRSIAWYSKAAMKGDLDSQLALSGWYLTGSEGVIQQSDTEAYLWARKAAEKGLAKAEYALGYFTEVGIGVPANLDEAKRWYYKAASQQHPKAQLRLQELKKGGVAVQKSRERLSRSNAKDGGDCVIM